MKMVYIKMHTVSVLQDMFLPSSTEKSHALYVQILDTPLNIDVYVHVHKYPNYFI